MMLHIEGLSVEAQRYDGWFGRQSLSLLRGVDLTVARNEMVAIIGQSGAGKSILAQAILGLLPKTAHVSGSMLFDGAELTPDKQKSIRGKKIALIPQAIDWLDPTATIGRQGCWSGRIQRSEVVRVFARYALPEPVLALYPHQMSGGMARRTLIAMATLSKADLLIADEPTAGLDPECRSLALGLLRALVEEGHGVAVITHDVAAIMPFADRLVILQGGRSIEQTDPSRFFAGALEHPYSRALRCALPHYGFQAPGDA